MANKNAKKNRKNKLNVLRKKNSKIKALRRHKSLVVSIIVILFLIGIAEFAYFFFNFYVKVYDVFLRVDNRIGINVDVESSFLNLGIIPPGGNVKREIIIVNTGNESLKGNVVTNGNLARFLSIEKNFAIPVGETKSLSVIANVPPDTKTGNYTAKIILIFRKSKTK